MTQHAWKQLLTGISWDLLKPDASKIYLQDIVYPMAGIYRYGNHARTPVDLLWHSIHVEAIAEGEAKPYALLHDVHEAFLGDKVTPVEIALDVLAPGFKSAWRSMKYEHDLAIWKAFGLALPSEDIIREVRRADIQALANERHLFLEKTDCPGWPDDLPEPAPPVRFIGSPGETAKNVFRFVRLVEKLCPKIPQYTLTKEESS